MTTRTLAANAAALPADTIDRRTLLASAGAAAVLAAIGTPVAAAMPIDPDAPLWALRTRWVAKRAALQTAMDEHDAALRTELAEETLARQDEAHGEDGAVVDEIAATPARSFAGLGFKVEVSSDWEHGHEALTASIMADVAALAAAHPAARI